MGALRRGLVRLQEHYERVRAEPPFETEPTSTDRRALDLNLPYPLRQPNRGIAGLDREVQDPLRALGLLPCTATRLGAAAGDGKLLFLARRQLPTGGGADEGPSSTAREEQVVVKFCMRPFGSPTAPGEVVHRLWAERGLAPQLHGVLRLPGGIDMVVMEYLDPEAGWVSLRDDDLPQLEALQFEGVVQAALATGHALRTGDGMATIHGDCRSNNIMVRRTSGRKPVPEDVRFVDFDWAGIDGQARCPTFINQEALWAEGVETGALLTQELESATLSKNLEARRAS